MIKLSSITGATVFGTDGQIGRIKDIYFDDRTWALRYIVVDTGGWLTGRRVLLSPLGIDGLTNGRMVANLTRRQIEESPPIWQHEPVSREYERRYHWHFNWPYYWSGRVSTLGAADSGVISESAPNVDNTEKTDTERTDPHLRSAAEVRGYRLEAIDGPIGHVEDFILEEGEWVLRYLVLDTKIWWPGKKVLLSPGWIAQVDWGRSALDVALARDEIKTAPAYNERAPLSRRYEERLFDHYGRDPHWAAHAEFL